MSQIPLEGARVRIIDGPGAGKEGYAVVVYDGHEELRRCLPAERPAFVKSQRARFGENWIDSYYTAEVEFPDGSSLHVEGRALQLLEPDMARPEGFKPHRIR